MLEYRIVGFFINIQKNGTAGKEKRFNRKPAVIASIKALYYEDIRV